MAFGNGSHFVQLESVNSLRPSDAYVCVNIYQAITGSDNGMSTAWHQAFIRTIAGVLLIGTTTWEQTWVIFEPDFLSRKGFWKCLLQNYGHFVLASPCRWWLLACHYEVIWLWLGYKTGIIPRFVKASLHYPANRGWCKEAAILDH